MRVYPNPSPLANGRGSACRKCVPSSTKVCVVRTDVPEAVHEVYPRTLRSGLEVQPRQPDAKLT